MARHCSDSCQFDHIWGHREMERKETLDRVGLAVTNDLVIPSITLWK